MRSFALLHPARSALTTLALTAAACSTPAPEDASASETASSTGGTTHATSGSGAPTSSGHATTDHGTTGTSSGADSESTSAATSTASGGSSSGDTADTSGTSGSSGDTSGSSGDTSGSSGDTSGDTSGSSGSSGSSTGEPVDEIVAVQLLAFNDFHGNLEPPSGSSGKITLPDNTAVDAGGAAYFATHLAALRAENPNTLVVSAGDLIGASPLISGLFHDEPTIELMNKLGLDYNAVGNHEFDEGWQELLRMQKGGCHPIDGCQDGTPFPGAAFEFLAANVLVQEEPAISLLPSYAIRSVDGVKIGLIGMTLEGTPDIVNPLGLAGLTFVDEAARANALVPELKAQGVETIVVLLHEGGLQTGTFDQCVGISGPIVAIAAALDPEIDVLITGHTHAAYNCVLGGRIVTSAASFGRLITDIDLEISAKSGDVVAASAANVIVTRELADPGVGSFVGDYKALVAPLANKPIGTITATLERFPPPNGPGISTMGLVAADAQLDATEDVMLGAAEIAFMNPGGVRADLVYAAAPNEPKDGVVTYGEIFTVQPFGNSLVVMTLTGAQIKQLLEQQFQNGLERVLQPSAGFTYAWSKSAMFGKKVDPASMKLGGVVIDPAKSYRVTVNSFLAAGGDGFSVLVQGTDRIGGALDLDALEAYFAAHSPVSPPPLDRVALLP